MFIVLKTHVMRFVEFKNITIIKVLYIEYLIVKDCIKHLSWCWPWLNTCCHVSLNKFCVLYFKVIFNNIILFSVKSNDIKNTVTCHIKRFILSFMYSISIFLELPNGKSRKINYSFKKSCSINNLLTSLLWKKYLSYKHSIYIFSIVIIY